MEKKKNDNKNRNKKKKGFTLIELLAIIVILGLLVAIAIPSVTKYITQSKRKTVVSSIDSYISSAITAVNDQDYKFTTPNTIYAVPIECISIEKGGTNPFGEWIQANNDYWAYVLVQYDSEKFSYNYGFTFKDSSGYGMYPTIQSEINPKSTTQIKTGLELTKPTSGKALDIAAEENWNGFDVDSITRVQVLQSRLEGDIGDGENTCTLHNKGLNYEEIENIKKRTGTLIHIGGHNYLNVFGKEMDKALIEGIYTLDYIDIPTDARDSWDASSQKNESVMAYITDRDNNELYELYLSQEGGVVAPSDSAHLFFGYTKASVIDLENFKTSNVTNMMQMFYRCDSVKTLNINSFNTTNVKNMNLMFGNCTNLKFLDLSNFNTSNVTSMNAMFAGAGIEKVDLSSFDTSNVTDMSQMFRLVNVNSLDLSNFNTGSVINMSHLFRECYYLTYLDFRNVDFSSVTNYGSMMHAVPKTIKIIVKDDTARNWILTNISSDYKNIIIVSEL